MAPVKGEAWGNASLDVDPGEMRGCVTFGGAMAQRPMTGSIPGCWAFVAVNST